MIGLLHSVDWFRDRTLGYALQEAYRGLVMVGRYPVGFLFFDVPPDMVDVNVHPTKAEVRFRDNSLMFSLIRGSVKQRLMRENLVPTLTVPVEQATESPRWETAASTVAPWETTPLRREPVPEPVVPPMPMRSPDVPRVAVPPPEQQQPAR